MKAFKQTTEQNIKKSQDKQKEAYAKRVQKKYQHVVYGVGDEVLLLNMRKCGRKGGRIEPDFSGPYVIETVCGKLVTLKNQEGSTLKTKYNISHLKPYRRSTDNYRSESSTHLPAKSNKSFSTPHAQYTVSHQPLAEENDQQPHDSTTPRRPSVIAYATKYEEHTEKIQKR